MERKIAQPVAVTIRDGCKTYNAGSRKATVVLSNFNMTVHTGSLYSLLGSSGSGKTTVLSCLVGVNKLDQGRLSVFGSKTVPISPNRWQRIGYMPQELSLHKEFSIVETLMYFGTLFDSVTGDTSRKYLLGRIEFLKELLRLPDVNRVVGTLSGGQQRRVSFAVALINEPELLLLDEPTSGVDPLVRESIWKYLIFLVAKKRTTIILTTHYVDEARDSDVVGVMRDGHMLVEENPLAIMNQYEVASLENAFLELCKVQDTGRVSKAATTPLTPKGPVSFNTKPRVHTITSKRSLFPPVRRMQNSHRRLRALVIKNYTSMLRNWCLLGFTTVIPAFCMLITCITFLRDPRNIQLGVVNLEVENARECFQNLSSLNASCNTDEISCSFLRHVPDTIRLKFYDSMDQARAAVMNGYTWGYINFPKDYTEGIKNRILNGHDEIADDDLEGQRLWNSSKITVNLDQSNTVIYSLIVQTLYETFEKSSKRLLNDCGLDERNGQYPLQFQEPLVGSKDVGTLEYVAPGLSISILFFFSLGVSIRFIGEKREGTLERCVASGTKLWEIMLAFAISELGTVFTQSLLVFLILTYGFSVGAAPTELPLNAFLVFTLYFIEGLSGVTAGLLMGMVCQSEEQAAMITIAFIFPNAFLSGAFWPLEGSPYALQVIAPYLPMTLPTEAQRSLTTRRWDFLHPKVWPGFIVPLVYLSIFALLGFFLIKRQACNK